MKGIVLCWTYRFAVASVDSCDQQVPLACGQLPRAFHPIARLKQGGITDILLVTGRDHPGDVMELRSPCPCCQAWQPCIGLKGGLVALDAESQEDGDGNR